MKLSEFQHNEADDDVLRGSEAIILSGMDKRD